MRRKTSAVVHSPASSTSSNRKNKKAKEGKNAGDASAKAASKSRLAKKEAGSSTANSFDSSVLVSRRVGEVLSSAQEGLARRKYKLISIILKVVICAAVFCALVAVSFGIIKSSSLFTIKEIDVSGVEHLTEEEVSALISISEGTTLLNVDISTVKNALLSDAWIEEVKISRQFPSTLRLEVVERSIAAVVEIITNNGTASQDWAIASDEVWLMPIPEKDSEAGQRTSPLIYEEAAQVLRITGVPYGISPEIGTVCSDENVNNALAIVSSLTTELADRIIAVDATETESTTLTVENGPDIVFGPAEYVREKERVCLQIMEDHPEGVSYINVRDVENPTWRSS